MIVALSHMRFAAGVCVLTSGLLMGGAGGAIAVAVADPDSSGSAAKRRRRQQRSGPGQHYGEQRGWQRYRHIAAGRNEHAWLGPATRPAAFPPARKARRKSLAALTPTTRTKDSAVIAARQLTVDAGSRCERRWLSIVVATAPDVVAMALDVVAMAIDVVAMATDVVATAPDVVSGRLPDVVAPVSDEIALVQDVLTSVAGTVVPLTQLQSEFYSFLLGIGGVETVVDAWGSIDSAALSAAMHAWVASHLPLILELAGIPGVPLAGNAAWFATLGGTAPATFCAAT